MRRFLEHINLITEENIVLLEAVNKPKSVADCVADATALGFAVSNYSKNLWSLTIPSEIQKKIRLEVPNIGDDYYMSGSFKNVKEYLALRDRLLPFMDPNTAVEHFKTETKAKGYEELKSLQSYSEHAAKNVKSNIQIYIPRYDAKDKFKGPLIPKIDTPPMGGFKPTGSYFWTSSIKSSRAKGKYSSSWNEFVTRNHPDWANNIGHAYKVSSSARILELNNDTAQRLVKCYIDLGYVQPNTKYEGELYYRLNFPWQFLPLHWDAVTVQNSYQYSDWGFMNFTYGYDAESTVWLNPKVLRYLGTVEVDTGKQAYDDDNDE